MPWKLSVLLAFYLCCVIIEDVFCSFPVWCLGQDYKNLYWLWCADSKFRHEGSCSASRDLPSDAEHLPGWRNFQFAPKNHYELFFLHTLPSKIVFKLPYALLLKHWNIYDMIDSVSTYDVDITKRLAENDVKIWRDDVKIWRDDIKNTTWRHARESSYTSRVRWHFLAPVGFTEIPVGYSRTRYSIGSFPDHCSFMYLTNSLSNFPAYCNLAVRLKYLLTIHVLSASLDLCHFICTVGDYNERFTLDYTFHATAGIISRLNLHIVTNSPL